ncbi:MAG: hypothetical protein DMG24_08680 [Acidobacteria bacterium]|nr:MAG: hypothetical protein DMG24_08680 [Acidobacteriota bacterium]
MPEPHYTQGVILWQQGKLDEAATEFRAAIRLRPGYAQAHSILGSVLRQKGDLEGALDELHQAVALDANDAAAHQSLGTVYRQKGDTAKAQEEFQKAETLNKAQMNLQAATLTTNTGAKQLRNGDLEGAIEKFHAALKLSPDFAAAHFQLALALRQKGDARQATEEFEKAYRLDPHLKPPPMSEKAAARRP